MQALVLATGFSIAAATREAVWESAGLDLPLFSAFPAVVAVAIALGPIAGIGATGTATAYVLVGPAAAAFSHWPAESQLVLISGFAGLSLLICLMVGMLDRRQSTDLSTLLKDLGCAEERLLTLATSLDGHLALFLDREGRIVGWFGGTCQLTGWTEREMLGMNLCTLYPAGRDGEARAVREFVAALDRGSSRVAGHCRRRDGGLFPAEVTLTALKRGEGCIAVIRDLRPATSATTLVAA